MVKSDIVTIKVTQRQGKILWGILDGANDAGSCKDGLTEEEHETLLKAINQILKQRNW